MHVCSKETTTVRAEDVAAWCSGHHAAPMLTAPPRVRIALALAIPAPAPFAGSCIAHILERCVSCAETHAQYHATSLAVAQTTKMVVRAIPSLPAAADIQSHRGQSKGPSYPTIRVRCRAEWSSALSMMRVRYTALIIAIATAAIRPKRPSIPTPITIE